MKDGSSINYPKKSDIYLVCLDPVLGSEIGKARPALVVSNDQNNQFSGTVTVLPITSQVTKIYPFEVFLAREISNLPKDSKIKCNQIRTVDKLRLIKFLGSLPPEKMKEVEQAILIHLGIGISYES